MRGKRRKVKRSVKRKKRIRKVFRGVILLRKKDSNMGKENRKDGEGQKEGGRRV